MKKGSPGDDAALSAEWLAFSDALVRGLGHALNNRVAALSAVVQVLTSEGEAGPLGQALSSESHRLLRTVELMRLLPRRWDAEPEPVLVEDVIRSGLELLPLHAELPELSYVWESEGELPPVLSEPSLLVHTVCLMGTWVAGAAVRSGDRVVTLKGRSDGVTVTVRMSTAGSRVFDEDRLGSDPDVPSIDPSVVERLARLAGGSLRKVDGDESFAVELELPTLAESRRREREGAPRPG